MKRVFFYLQHVLGIGHARRAAVLVAAMVRHGLEVTLVDGGLPIPGLDFAGAERIQLPPLRSGDRNRGLLLDSEGRAVTRELWEKRRGILAAAFEQADPGLLLIEMFPLGRLDFLRELLPLAEMAAARRVPCWTSVRDIVIEPSPGRAHLMASLAQRHCEKILVHADPAVGRLEDSFPPAAGLADRLDYTGFVVGRLPALEEAPATQPKGVVVSAGGGAVGESLLRRALAARPLSRFADRPWHLLCGVHADSRLLDELRQQAPVGVSVETAHPDLPELLASAAVSVSQAGYNTVIETTALRVPMVLVPFADAHGDQVERARRWAARGLATVLDEAVLDEAALDAADLGAASLAAAIDVARPPLAQDLDLLGADRTATILIERLSRR